jgi:hypothetical protein
LGAGLAGTPFVPADYHVDNNDEMLAAMQNMSMNEHHPYDEYAARQRFAQQQKHVIEQPKPRTAAGYMGGMRDPEMFPPQQGGYGQYQAGTSASTSAVSSQIRLCRRDLLTARVRLGIVTRTAIATCRNRPIRARRRPMPLTHVPFTTGHRHSIRPWKDTLHLIRMVAIRVCVNRTDTRTSSSNNSIMEMRKAT